MASPVVVSELFVGPASTPNNGFDVVQHYNETLAIDENLAVPLVALQSLTECVKRSRASTMQELTGTLKSSIERLKKATTTPISTRAGCDLFLHFLITHPSPTEDLSFRAHRDSFVRHATKFVSDARSTCVEKVAHLASGFIEDGSTIMIHGYSRVVLHTILRAFSPSQTPRKRFQVYVTESRPSEQGLRTHAILQQHGIPCVVVLDSAVAHVMGKVDLVMVGAEAVLVDGGLINYIGSYQMAIAAKAHHKPFYALTESYKFLRLLPLSQYDLPTTGPILEFSQAHRFIDSVSRVTEEELRLPRSTRLKTLNVKTELSLDEIAKTNPNVDYTTPDLITLVFSDSGILTPAGVAEHLLSVFGSF